MGNTFFKKKQTQQTMFKNLNELAKSSLQSHKNILISLDRYSAQLNDDFAQNLSSSLQQCVNLQILKLYLDKIPYKQYDLSQIGSALVKCTQLRNLILGGNQNDLQNLMEIVLPLKDSQNLQMVVILATSLVCSPMFLSDEQLKRMEKKMNWNSFELESMAEIGNALVRCTKLRSLMLSLIGLKIGNQGVLNIISALENCLNIQYIILELYYTQIDDEAQQKIRRQLKKAKKLVKLRLLM
ncbi:hypothetical protein ABPG74_013185 [Tetrahymena malaccensis]